MKQDLAVPESGASNTCYVPTCTSRIQGARSRAYVHLNAFNNLGALYSDQGKLAEAEKMHQSALQGKEKALGPEHMSTLLTVNNLGTLYWHQGKLAEAEEMYQRALQGYEKVLGPEHTSTLDTVNNLGNLYSDQGKLAEAEQMYQRTLQGREKALGLEHPDTLTTVNNLGVLYGDQGNLAEAEQMYRRALQGFEKALGPEHTLALNTVNNLGALYRDQGKLAEAEAMFWRALHGYEKALGPEHTSTLTLAGMLSNLYSNQGRLDEAEMCRRKFMATTDTVLSLDIGLHDCLYRIRRENDGISRVIYVKVADLDIIPEERRTYGPSILGELSTLKGWNGAWDTLTICKNRDEIQCCFDAFRPHSLQEAQTPGDYDRFNVLNIHVLESVKDRVFRVASRSGPCFLKIARFSHELPWLAQEIAVYHILTTTKTSLAPKLLGYAFEERGKRVIGFLFEEVTGRVPRVEDLEVCEKGLQQLHDLDIIHGDINKYNMFITDDGVKFIDFEDSHVGPTAEDNLKAEEMRSLKDKLLDDSGKGRPWTTNES